MRRNMGLDYGLESTSTCMKRKFRWLFKIPEVSATGAVNALPPEKGARPQVSFKEIAAEHLNETIVMPGKPEWKSINLTLYDLKKNKHPVFEWVQKLYDPCSGSYYPFMHNNFKVTGKLELYNGCGDVIEEWEYRNIWPQAVDWGELNMAESGYLVCNLTLRFDRAYITTPNMC